MDSNYPSDSPSVFTRMWNKVKQKPAFYTGVGTLSVIVGIGLNGLRTRKMRMSLYLINLRLAAQGSFVAIVVGSVAYSLINQQLQSKPSDKVDYKLK